MGMNKLSGYACPKCHKHFLFWEWKKMKAKGYSCQTCGYNFMIDEVDWLTERDRKTLVLERAKQTLSRKGF